VPIPIALASVTASSAAADPCVPAAAVVILAQLLQLEVVACRPT
jgi:hypothetical protein